MNNTGNVHNHALTQQKKEDLAGLMEAWGQGKLREYLAPDLAKIDAAAAKRNELETPLQHWRSEQQFAEQLNSLYAELANAESELVQRAEEAEAARKKLESVQQTIRDTRRKNAE